MKKLSGIIATMLLVASVGVCQDQAHNPACPADTVPYVTTRDGYGKLHDQECLNVLTGQISWTNLAITPGLGGDLSFADNSAQSAAATGGPPIVAKVDLTAQTAAITTTTIYTPTTDGFYVVWMEGFIEWATGTDSMTSTVDFMQNGSYQSIPNVLNISASSASAARGGQWVLYEQARSPIQYSTSWSSGGAGNSYDIHIRVQQME